MTLVRYVQGFEVLTARAHGGNGVSGEHIGIGSAYDHGRNAGQRVKFLPKRRQRPFEPDTIERSGKSDVVVGNECAVLLFVGAPRKRDPVLRREFWKLNHEQAAQDFGTFFKASWLRQFSDIALDPQQAARLDHRADIVEDDA